MKTTILVIGFIFGCIVSTYSQINQKRKGAMTKDNASGFHHDIKSAFGYNKMIIPNGFQNDKMVDSFLPKDSQWVAGTQGGAFVQDRMPCYKPEGVFSMRIIKPDTSQYKMLIKKY